MLDPAGDVAYVPHVNFGLHAIFTANGTIKWIFPKAVMVNDIPPSTVAVGSYGVLYIAAIKTLFALYTSNGSNVWQIPLPFDNIGVGVSISPLDGTIFLILVDGSLVAVDPSGKTKWIKKVLDQSPSDFYYFGTPVIHPYTGIIYIRGIDQVVSVKSSDGSVVWASNAGGCGFQYGCFYDGIVPTLAPDGTLFGSAFGCSLFEYPLYIISIKANGDLNWQQQYVECCDSCPLTPSDPTIDGTGKIVFISTDNRLNAYEIATGNTIWTVSGSGGGSLCPCPPPMDYARSLMACWLP